MSENILKMTDGELAEIKLLKDKFQQKVYELGNLQIQKIQLEKNLKTISNQESKLKDEWDNLLKMDEEFVQTLLQKYGEGRLDVSKGVFIRDEVKK